MSNELVAIQHTDNPYAIMPVLDVAMAANRRQAVIDYTRRMMIPKVDYGTVPGTGDKPTLLKPGAEKLASLFGLSPDFEPLDSVMDWTGKDHGGEPFFFVRYRCTLRRGDMAVGQGVGSCNSWEKKYRYRKAQRVCPNCGTAAIIKGKNEYGGGWLCFKKADGCGSKFNDGDPAIENQEVGQVKNADPADVVNTIDKMAQKRALVAAVLIAVNASELFTQDVEDYSDVIDGDWEPTVKPAQPQPQTQPVKTAAQPKPAANGKATPVKPAQPQPEPPPADPGPLPDDEQVVYEAAGKEFVTIAAAILETDMATVKTRLQALGYERIPGDKGKRLDAFRRLKTDLGPNVQAELFGEDDIEPEPVKFVDPA